MKTNENSYGKANIYTEFRLCLTTNKNRDNYTSFKMKYSKMLEKVGRKFIDSYYDAGFSSDLLGLRIKNII